MKLRYFVFLALVALAIFTFTVDAKSLKAHKKSHKHHGKLLKALISATFQKEAEKKKDDSDVELNDASGSAGESGSGEESGAPPVESEAPEPANPLPFKVVGPFGGHPHPGPPSAINPCPQPRYCDPARCKDPVGCAPSCADICCADVVIPPPTPPVKSGGGPCSDACAPKYQADCCMGAPPPVGGLPGAFPQAVPQPVYPPMGPQPEYSAPTGMLQPEYVPQSPPAMCDQSCYATNCAPPCPAKCCIRKKSSIHHHRRTRSLTTTSTMCP
ncbi:basic proline-rich protein-like isoform X1 [Montipora foliosa]|uniref:basic proline-rich protein-like isoform X1 n=1 Tax=Montipora foliosa TaxID=591990 RepID=UPI0035F1C5A0